MSEIKHTPGPLFVRQPEKWPFNIEIVDTAGELVFEERRHCHGTCQKSVADAMNCRGFRNTRKDPHFVDRCIEANERQLADAYLRASAPELLDALKWYVENDDTNIGMEGNEFWEAGLERGKAAIAKATGSPS